MTNSYRAQIQLGVTGLEQLNKAQAAVDKLSGTLSKRFAKAIDTGNFDRLGVSLQRVAGLAGEASRNLNRVDVNNWAELRGAVKRVVDTLELRNSVQRKINKELDLEINKRDQLNKLVRQNVAASAASRGASNFGLGNAGDPIAKSVRRNEQRQERERARFLRGDPNATSLEAAPGGSPFRILQSANARLQQATAEIASAQAKASEELFTKELRNIERAATEGISADNKVFAQRQQAEDEYWKNRLQQARAASAAEQRLQSQDIRSNIARSRASRGGSGFGAFSQTADLTGRFGQTRSERELQVLRRENRRLSLQFKRENSSFKGDRTEAISSGLIGGGFPLLFGQGGGAAIGGGVGGALGGALGGGFGFGVSIVGTILGDAVDQFSNNAKALAASLKDPTAALAAMDTAGLAAGDNLKFAVQKLTELGQASQAQALVFAAINKQLGPDGVQNLNALDTEQKKLDAQYQRLAASLQSELLPILIATTGGMADLGEALGSIFKNPLVQLALKVGAAGVTAGGSIGAEAAFRGAQQAGRERARGAGQSRALTPDQQLNQAGAPGIAAQRELDAFNAVDRFRQAQINRANEQKDLDQQRADLVLSQERAIGDLRLSIERQVQDARIQNLARANQIADAQGQLRLANQANNSQGRRLEFASSDPAANAVANALVDYEQAIASIDEQSAKRKRDVALEIVNVELQAERNKADIAKQIIRLNEDSARQIARLNESVARINSQESRQRFDLEKKIAANKLEVLANESKLIAGQLAAFGRTPQDRANVARFSAVGDAFLTRANQIQNQQPPPPLRGLAGVGAVGADTSGLDAAASSATELINLLEQVNVQLDGATRRAALNKFGEAFDSAFTRPLDQALIQANKLAIAIDGFFATGVSPEIGAALQDVENRAQSIVKVLQNAPPEIIKALGGIAAKNGFPASLEGFVAFDKQKGQNVRTQQSVNDVGQSLVEAQREANAEAARALDINGRNAVTTATIIALKERGLALDSGAAQDALAIAEGIDAQNEATRRLISDQERTRQLYEDIGSTIESGIVNSISAAIDGTQSLNDVLTQTLKQLGQILIQFSVNSALNSLGGGGGIFGKLFPGRAKGGPVNAGKPYVVGDNPDGTLNSTSELFIPGTSGTIVPADVFEATQEALSTNSTSSDSGQDADAFTATRESLSQSSANISSNGSSDFAATQQAVNASTERVREQQYNEMRLQVLSGQLDPVEVKLDAFDPAGAGLATVEQVARVAQSTANTVQAQMLRRMRTDPGFRRRQGV